MKHLQQIEKLVANGNLRNAIRLALDAAEQSKKHGLRNRLLQISSNYEALEKDRTAGTLNEESYRTGLAQSTKALIDCLKIEPCPSATLPDKDNPELVEVLLEKLQYFRVEYNITADTTKKFELRKRIQEIESELGKNQ